MMSLNRPRDAGEARVPPLRIISFVFVVLLMLIGSSIQAQTVTDVWVTTQDFSSLRVGPGIHFERIAIVDPAVTLPAIGRSPRTNWVQVDFNGQHGWIAAKLLVWTGDIISLPVDGVDPAPYVRKQAVSGVFTADAPIYARELAGSDQVGVLPAETVVELTGRLGDPSLPKFWVQILYQDTLYWTGSWNIKLTNGSFYELQDTSYLYPYGRLVTALTADINRNRRLLAQIESIWLDLNNGFGANCDFAPDFASTGRATDTDIRQEVIFAPAVTALDTAVLEVNSAISGFTDACNRTDVYVTQQEVRDALNHIDTARRNLNIALSFTTSLGRRNPLLGN